MLSCNLSSDYKYVFTVFCVREAALLSSPQSGAALTGLIWPGCCLDGWLGPQLPQREIDSSGRKLYMFRGGRRGWRDRLRQDEGEREQGESTTQSEDGEKS